MNRRHFAALDIGSLGIALNAIEGSGASFDLVGHGRSGPHAAVCIAVRSGASRRVYLLVNEDAPQSPGWRHSGEIIGFEGLHPLLRRRRVPGALRRVA